MLKLIDLQRSPKAYSVFRKLGYTDLFEIEGLPKEELLRFPNIGPKTAQEILDILAERKQKP